MQVVQHMVARKSAYCTNIDIRLGFPTVSHSSRSRRRRNIIRFATATAASHDGPITVLSYDNSSDFDRNPKRFRTHATRREFADGLYLYLYLLFISLRDNTPSRSARALKTTTAAEKEKSVDRFSR